MEPTFRNTKGEVGLRPVWHAMQDRLQAHLIVAVLADYEVHLLCMLLLARKGIHTSWVGIRSQLSSWLRVTATLKAATGELISPGQATRADTGVEAVTRAAALSNPVVTQGPWCGS